jgi:hypothetical protein
VLDYPPKAKVRGSNPLGRASDINHLVGVEHDALTSVSAHCPRNLFDSRSRREIPAVSTLAVYDGQTRIGHVISRGRSGFEAFDADDQSLSTFATAQRAAAAISNTNTSPQNESPDAARRRQHRGNSVCPQEVPNGHHQYPRRRPLKPLRSPASGKNRPSTSSSRSSCSTVNHHDHLRRNPGHRVAGASFVCPKRPAFAPQANVSTYTCHLYLSGRDLSKGR